MPRAVIDVIITQVDRKVTKEETKWTVRVLKGFHARSNCKLTYGNKSQTQLSLVWCT